MNKELTIEKIKLPQDWKTLPFGDVCEISGGSQPPKPTFIYEPKEGYIRLIQVRDYRTSNFITYIPKDRAKKFCNKTDIMIGRYGPPIFGIFRGLEGAYNVALMKAIPNEELLDKEFLYWFLKTDSLVKFVEKSSKRAAGQDGVRKEVLYTYPTPIPPLIQQKQIVATLDKAFTAIDTALANAEQNLKNTKELFESYLQNIFENKGDDWEEKTLGEICKIIGGGTPSKKREEFYNGDILWATVRDMKGDSILNTEHKITEDAVKNSATNIIPKGNVIIATRVGLGKVCLLENNSAINQDLKGVIPNDKKVLSIPFLFRWFTSISDKIVNEGTGATVQGVKLTFVNSLLIPLPSIKEQQKIVNKLETLSSETKKIEAIYTQKIADLKELKKSILQKAFSGQLSEL